MNLRWRDKLRFLWAFKGGVDMHLPASWKKFAAAAIAGLIMAVGPQLGLEPDQCQLIAAIAVAFILGQGMADFGKSRKVYDAYKEFMKK